MFTWMNLLFSSDPAQVLTLGIYILFAGAIGFILNHRTGARRRECWITGVGAAFFVLVLYGIGIPSSFATIPLVGYNLIISVLLMLSIILVISNRYVGAGFLLGAISCMLAAHYISPSDTTFGISTGCLCSFSAGITLTHVFTRHLLQLRKKAVTKTRTPSSAV